jgi:hypothetical protein
MYLTLSPVLLAVQHHRFVFERWVRERPLDCAQLLEGLRFSAYSLPDAAKLVGELEELLARSGESRLFRRLATAFPGSERQRAVKENDH